MTFVLKNKIRKKDLPIFGLDDLGLPEMGKKIEKIPTLNKDYNYILSIFICFVYLHPKDGNV